MSDFSASYDQDNFWEKVSRVAKKAGRDVLEKALILYYVLQDDDTPMWAKTVIIGALGYFISPVDAVPDFLPGGYVDDAGVLAGAFVTVAVAIKSIHKEQAKAKVSEWLD